MYVCPAADRTIYCRYNLLNIITNYYYYFIYKFESEPKSICIAPTDPPSTFNITPVKYDPAFELKYIHAPAISFSLPILPNGIDFFNLSVVAPHVFNPDDILVSTKPGANALQVICLDAKSPANFFVNECTAAFDASYAYVGANILYCIVLYLLYYFIEFYFILIYFKLIILF